MTINEAIFNVITTQRKKDMKSGAFDMVKKAGYQVTYRGGGQWWEVRNSETYKCVYARLNYRQELIIEIGNKSKKLASLDTSPINFDAYLNKPINRAYYSACSLCYQPTKDKYSRLVSARDWVRYYTENAEKAKKEIASKIKDLEYATARRASEEAELKAIRKEYGLKGRR